METDWKKLISEIEQTGLSQESIGQSVGLTQGAISQLKNIGDREPKYRHGAKLIELHRRVTKQRKAA